MSTRLIPISSIRRDGGTQPRAALDESAVRDYAAAIQDGAAFPPVRVFYDGESYWLSNGFHRTAAHELAGLNEIEAEIIQGTQRDAQWDSFAANKEQGLRRQSEDVRRILFRIFSDPQWANLSQREIAQHTGVAKSWVGVLLTQYREQTGQDGPRKGPAPHNKGQSSKAASDSAPADSARARADETSRPDAPTADGGEAGDEVPEPQPGGAPAADAPPWAGYERDIREVVSDLRAAYRKLAKATSFDTEGKRFANEYARAALSHGGTLGVISTLCRALEDSLPVELSADPPGFLTAARARMRDAVRKSA